MEPGTPRLARLHTRTTLAMAAWAGNRSIAARVVTELVCNAVKHVGTGEVTLALVIGEDEELLIEVTDPSPEFGGYEAAVAEEGKTGLGLIRALGCDIDWDASPIGGGKSIQAQIRLMQA
ncbi:ATP-binding protein [Streptomyces sp. NPDC048420]|uniref:ATP-binding protein n=1 Tax=Streptomyces sp. NPDC048420 TaxID=3155755 RepID=UPI00342795FE